MKNLVLNQFSDKSVAVGKTYKVQVQSRFIQDNPEPSFLLNM